MTEPTDSEILDAADYFRPQYMHGGITFDEFDSIGFARAVLAKWGTPATVGVEPVAYFVTGGRVFVDSAHVSHDHATRSARNNTGAVVKPLYTAEVLAMGRVPLPRFLTLKFQTRRDKKATVTLLFNDHETADAWVRGITHKEGGQHAE